MSNETESEIYERNVNTSVQKGDGDVYITKSSLLDLNHNMILIINVDIKSFSRLK